MTKAEEKKQEPKVTAQHVHVAVNQVKAAIAKTGISKDRNNQAQGYKFRGIDDVYNALAPILAEASLNVYPNVLKREVVERTNQKGTALFYVTVEVRFDFVSAIDGSIFPVVTYGEAMDSGDKATNKAMSAALKYAFMQTFCIPTEGDNDADSQTHEVQANGKAFTPDWPENHPCTKEEAGKLFKEAEEALTAVHDDEDLKSWVDQYSKKTKSHLTTYQLGVLSKKYLSAETLVKNASQLNGHGR
jgi:hypothetical protein